MLYTLTDLFLGDPCVFVLWTLIFIDSRNHPSALCPSLRLAVGSTGTQLVHVKQAWERIKEAADHVLSLPLSS